MASFTWSPNMNSATGVHKYTSFASFPPTAPNGTLALALDTDFLYAFNTTSNTWVQIGAGGGGASVVVQHIVLNSGQIAAKSVTLSGTPTHPAMTLVTVIGGPLQDYTVDYVVSGSTLSWSGLGLEALLAIGDELVIQFL